jgi:hypothetical protein
MRFWKRELPDEEIARLVREAVTHQHVDDRDKAWDAVAPLRRVQKRQRVAAQGLAMLLKGGAFDRERGLELAGELLESRGDEAWVVAAIADAAEVLHDVRYLNNAPPREPIFETVARRLEEMLGDLDGEDEINALEGLTTVGRVLGRSWDEVTERAHRRLLELAPDGWQNHYNLGLFFKTRGRFAEGQAVNQRAVELGGGDSDEVLWNLGICATGAGDAAVALSTWKSLRQSIEMGCFDLPEGGYHPVKVRLVEFPLAARAASDPQEPGREETVWIERLSPCHGVVRCALVQDIGVDYGDVVMFDGAAITFHAYGDERVPVFPHLATLSRQGYQVFPFAGSQQRTEQIGELSEQLPGDAVVYVHSEQFQNLCTACWEDPDRDHLDHSADIHGVVTGKVCAPPTLDATTLREELDRALDRAREIKLFVPDLTLAAGDPARADVERRRMAMITVNDSEPPTS